MRAHGSTAGRVPAQQPPQVKVERGNPLDFADTCFSFARKMAPDIWSSIFINSRFCYRGTEMCTLKPERYPAILDVSL
jgi:hypothetical protein